MKKADNLLLLFKFSSLDLSVAEVINFSFITWPRVQPESSSDRVQSTFRTHSSDESTSTPSSIIIKLLVFVEATALKSDYVLLLCWWQPLMFHSASSADDLREYSFSLTIKIPENLTIINRNLKLIFLTIFQQLNNQKVAILMQCYLLYNSRSCFHWEISVFCGKKKIHTACVNY